MTFTIIWDDREEHVASTSSVEILLDQLHAQMSNGDPTLVSIERESTGDSLSFQRAGIVQPADELALLLM